MNPDAIWIDKGGRFFQIPHHIKRRFDCPLVHYTADPAFSVHTSRHFERPPLFDLCVTNKKYELLKYRRQARKNPFRIPGHCAHVMKNMLHQTTKLDLGRYS